MLKRLQFPLVALPLLILSGGCDSVARFSEVEGMWQLLSFTELSESRSTVSLPGTTEMFRYHYYSAFGFTPHCWLRVGTTSDGERYDFDGTNVDDTGEWDTGDPFGIYIAEVEGGVETVHDAEPEETYFYEPTTEIQSLCAIALAYWEEAQNAEDSEEDPKEDDEEEEQHEHATLDH